MRVACSGLRVWASRNCLLEEGGVSEACGPVDRLARTLVPRVLSLAFLKHEREPWEQGWLLARWLEYKVVNYDAIEPVAAINRFVVAY